MIPLYIYLRADAGRGFFVQSATNAVVHALRRFHRGERVRFKLVFLDAYPEGGVVEPFTVRDGAGYRARVGIRLGAALLAYSSNWTWNAADECFHGTLSLSTAELNAALDADGERLRATFEVELSGGPLAEVYKADQTIEILNSALTEQPQVVDPLALEEYYNKGATDLRFVQNRATLTGLTGGGDLNLDGLPTAGDLQTVGTLAAVVLQDELSFYQLQNGTQAEDAPEVVWPDDFDAAGNPKLWVRVGAGGAGGAGLQYWDESTEVVGGGQASRWTPNPEGLAALAAPVTPDVLTAAVASFGTYPTGRYRVYYVEGALDYGPSRGQFKLNARAAFGFRVVHSGGTELEGPGHSYQGFPTEAQVAAENAGAYVEFDHVGPAPIGVRLEDDPLGDNMAGTPAPTFRLVGANPNLHAVLQPQGTGSVIVCDGLAEAPAPTAESQKVERFAGGYRRLGGNSTHEGRVAGADPVDAQDFVTKAWGEANLGGGGGSTGQISAASGAAIAARQVVWQDVTNRLGNGRTQWYPEDLAATPPHLGAVRGLALTADSGTTAGVGTAWTARESVRQWVRIAASADGSKLVTAVEGGQLYTSADAGVTWIARESNRNWLAVASSADGTKLVAAVNGGFLYTSANAGATWTARESSRSWRAVAASADGTKLVAGASGGQLYTSTDAGGTWTARESSRYWRCLAASADGMRLVAGDYGGQLYTSTDAGGTWTARESNRLWKALAASADGTRLVAAVWNGQLYTSTDSGATWTARESARNWQAVAASADGMKLVAVVYGGQIYISVDAGVTWTARASDRSWNGVASSADGSRLAATDLNGQIHTSTAGAYVPGTFLCLTEPGDVAGFAGLTPGARQFSHPSTPGALTETEPTSGQLRRLHGRALSATVLRFDPRGFEPQQQATPDATRFLNEFGQFAVPDGTGTAAVGELPVVGELLAGACDGSNATFTAAHLPLAGSYELFLGTQRLREDLGHYTRTGAAVVLDSANLPADDTERPVLNYRYAAAGAPAPASPPAAPAATDLTLWHPNETLLGVVDGSNAVFTLPADPAPGTRVQVLLDGGVQRPYTDAQTDYAYTLSGRVVTFVTGVPAGMWVSAAYWRQAG